MTGRVRGAGGAPRSWFWTLGAARRGQLWESTVIPEIREQAVSISSEILSSLGNGARVARPAHGGHLVADNSRLAMSP